MHRLRHRKGGVAVRGTNGSPQSQVGQILSNFVIEQFVLTFDYASSRLAPVEMFVSSNPRRRSFPQGSLLKQGCGVSLTELCLTTIKFP